MSVITETPYALIHLVIPTDAIFFNLTLCSFSLNSAILHLSLLIYSRSHSSLNLNQTLISVFHPLVL
jgi:hypothetical protein